MAATDTSRLAFWLKRLELWRERGGTLKAYAEANGLSVTGLYGARRSWVKATAPAHATLLPVQLSAARRSEVIRIALPNGVLVEVPAGLNASEWAPLLRLCGQSS